MVSPKLKYAIKNLPALWRSAKVIVGAKAGSLLGSLTMYGELEAKVHRFLEYTPGKGLRFGRGTWTAAGDFVPDWNDSIDYGLLSARVVTDAGVAFLVDDWDNNAKDITNFNAHGMGTTNTAESASDTALGAEVETRQTGTKSQPAANQIRSVGTITATATRAIVEHGLFDSTTVAGSTLWDRSVFSTINLSSGDSIQFTYTLTVNSGG